MDGRSTKKAARSKWGNVKQLPSGRYRARYTANGQPQSIAGTFRTKAEAQSALNRKRIEIEDGEWIDRRTVPTLAEYVDHFNLVRTTRTGAPVKTATRKLSDGNFRNYLLPEFGNRRLDEIGYPAVKRWRALLPHSRSHTRVVYSLLHAVMEAAKDEGLIRVNPCRVPAAGSAATYEERAYVPLSHFERIIAAMPTAEGRLALVALHTQTRRGELLALRGANVDLEARTMEVRRTLASDGTEAPTKSGRTRTITLDDETVELLRTLIRDESARVFQRPDGSVMREWHVTRAWNRARAEADLPGVWFHDMRHTGLTLLANAGLPIKELMARAGHSTSVASLNYQHRADSMRRRASDAFSEALAADRALRGVRSEYASGRALRVTQLTNVGGLDILDS